MKERIQRERERGRKRGVAERERECWRYDFESRGYLIVHHCLRVEHGATVERRTGTSREVTIGIKQTFKHF